MQTLNESRTMIPALEKYAKGPLSERWKRPGLSHMTAVWLRSQP